MGRRRMAAAYKRCEEADDSDPPVCLCSAEYAYPYEKKTGYDTTSRRMTIAIGGILLREPYYLTQARP